jgi:hypothetical protein
MNKMYRYIPVKKQENKILVKDQRLSPNKKGGFRCVNFIYDVRLLIHVNCSEKSIFNHHHLQSETQKHENCNFNT